MKRNMRLGRLKDEIESPKRLKIITTSS